MYLLGGVWPYPCLFVGEVTHDLPWNIQRVVMMYLLMNNACMHIVTSLFARGVGRRACDSNPPRFRLL